MKNVIPVITAVILGLAAVFAVSQIMKRHETTQEPTIAVTVAARTLIPGEVGSSGITNDALGHREVPLSALPKQYIPYNNKNIILGQQVIAPIAKDDYVLLDKIGLSSSMGNFVNKGEWGVPVEFNDDTLLEILQAGDEIAIIGIFKVSVPDGQQMDANAPQRMVEKNISTVLYPRVQVQSKCGGNAILVSMPPKQAIALVNLQQKCKLYPVLRKPNDDLDFTRLNIGMFDDSSLNKLLDDGKGNFLQSIEIQ